MSDTINAIELVSHDQVITEICLSPEQIDQLEATSYEELGDEMQCAYELVQAEAGSLCDRTAGNADRA